MVSTEIMIQTFTEAYTQRLEPKTIQSYRRSIEQLVSYCEKSIIDITTPDIRRWMTALEMKGFHPNTIGREIKGPKLFFQYALEEGMIDKNPAKFIPFPKREESLPKYLDMEQLTQLRNLVDKGRPVHRALVEVFYSTGVRLSELIAMKKEDINWGERIILIPKGKGKKGRIVLFTRECEQYLKRYLNNREDDLPFVFVNSSGTSSLAQTTIRYRFQKYSRKLGFHMYPHLMRHTFAAHLAIKGMPLKGIQELLGHEDPNQTEVYARLYSHARKQKYDEFM